MKKTKSAYFLLTLAILLSSCGEKPSSPLSSSPNLNSNPSLTSSSSTLGGDENLPYYANLNKTLTKAPLKTALFTLISPHTMISYGELKTAYGKTDLREDGTIWDMYSNIKYKFGDASKVCGSYSKEGDCWNREHSIPQSWFGEASPMRSDLFHVYPTDGKVNGVRNNYYFGEVKTPSYTSTNGSKLGTNENSVPGGPGTVFEPIDEYKGDFARTYFYMATAYEDKCNSWGENFGKGTFPSLTDYSLGLFLKWHKLDPVSKKETDRNEAVFKIQKNRNPFIDYPAFVSQIWE